MLNALRLHRRAGATSSPATSAPFSSAVSLCCFDRLFHLYSTSDFPSRPESYRHRIVALCQLPLASTRATTESLLHLILLLFLLLLFYRLKLLHLFAHPALQHSLIQFAERYSTSALLFAHISHIKRGDSRIKIERKRKATTILSPQDYIECFWEILQIRRFSAIHSPHTGEKKK